MMDAHWQDVFSQIFLFFTGACFGSFANVVIYRLPRGESVSRPRSYCPHCKTTIRALDNIPILSWGLLRGRCRACGSAVRARYPFVELLMAVLFWGIQRKYGGSFYFYELLVLVWGLVVISFIDCDLRIIPDKLSLPGMALGLAGALLNPERSIADSLLGLVAGGGFLWLVAFLYLRIRKQEGMGGGDIKLLAWIGSVLGWKSIVFIILTSSLGGSLVGAAIGLAKKSGLKTAIPFGPFIAAAAIAYVFWGENITRAYVHFFLPGLD